MPRLDGVPGNAWPPEMLNALAALRPPPEHQPKGGANRARRHPALEAFAIHPELAQAFFTFNRHVLWGTTLPHRLRHIVILRVAARRRAAFVWGEHATQAREAGLDDAEIAAIGSLAPAPLRDVVEAALLAAVDELIDDGVVSPTTWDALAGGLTPPQLVDVVFTAGCYNTVAWFTRSIELDADPENPDRLPSAERS
jgi:alkylhydroperoxidase family enzyme